MGTLETLPGLIHERGLRPPATIIVGDVVRLREKLSWYEKLPLFGQSVVVTRARDQAGALASLLEGLGAKVIELPAIEIQPALDYGPLDRALASMKSWDWIVFTSANGVRFFLDRLDRAPCDLRSVRGRICAIGPATRDALARFHVKIDVVAGEYVAEGLLRALEGFDLRGSRVLIARAAVARDILPLELANRGAQVEVVEAYRTIPPAGLASQADEVLSRRPDWITFTSSSTVENLISAIGPAKLAGIRVASIGPVTSATLRKHNIGTEAEASVYTVPGLVNAILSAGIIGS